MPFEEQMANRAIIDIDGNNLSSSFASLLCTNSVIIKIRVYCYVCVQYQSNWFSYNFVALFYRSIQIMLNPSTFYEELRPMEHYVPASLENFTRKGIEKEIENIVNAANLWCRGSMTSEGMGRDYDASASGICD